MLNLIPGIGEHACQEGSEEPCRVYFVANGVLAQGATPGDCVRYYEETAPPAGASCNLYVAETSPGAPAQPKVRFIATLSQQDASDWGAGLSSLVPADGDLSGRERARLPERPLSGVHVRAQPHRL